MNVIRVPQAAIDIAKQQITFTTLDFTMLLYLDHTIAPSTKQILQVNVSSDSPKEGTIVPIPEREMINTAAAVYTVSSEQTIPLVIANPSTEPKHLLLPNLRLQSEPLYTWTVQLVNESSQDRNKHLLATLRLDHVPPSECNSLQQLILEFSSLFLLDVDRLQSKIATPHELRLNTDTQPIFIKPYRSPPIFCEEIEKTTEKLLCQGIIRPSKSPWNSFLLMVPKKADAYGKKNIEWLSTTEILTVQ